MIKARADCKIGLFFAKAIVHTLCEILMELECNAGIFHLKLSNNGRQAVCRNCRGTSYRYKATPQLSLFSELAYHRIQLR